VKIYTDGRSINNPGPSYIGVVIKEGRREIKRISKKIGEMTSNEAEYRAVIEGIKEAIKMGAKNVEILTDSELIVKQIKGEYKVRAENLKKLNKKVKSLISKFEKFSIKHIPRDKNLAHNVMEEG